MSACRERSPVRYRRPERTPLDRLAYAPAWPSVPMRACLSVLDDLDPEALWHVLPHVRRLDQVLAGARALDHLARGRHAGVVASLPFADRGLVEWHSERWPTPRGRLGGPLADRTAREWLTAFADGAPTVDALAAGDATAWRSLRAFDRPTVVEVLGLLRTWEPCPPIRPAWWRPWRTAP